jgi:D-glycerate 3-kinase
LISDFVYSRKELDKVILPLVKKIVKKYNPGKTVIVGISGGQGTGKSCLAEFVKEDIKVAGYNVTSFSIDDFYNTFKQRKNLARKLGGNPFYQISRGMPGTHRVKMLEKVLQRAKKGKSLIIPKFDKSLHSAWGGISKEKLKINKKQDFIILEGWCLGMPYLSSKKFIDFCKKKKFDLKWIDPGLVSHKEVLKQSRSYLKLWKLIDYMVLLKADSLDLHEKWRYQQEFELKQKTGKGMSKEEIYNFVNVYLPFTLLCSEKVKSNVKIMINKKHEFYEIK